jgi:hypothetical protein
MRPGYIKLWRKLLDNQMWLAEPFTRGQAWVDLILCAAPKKHEAMIKGYGMKTVTLEVGETLAAHEYLAERWRWQTKKGTGGRRRVSAYLRYLEREQLIVQVKTEPCTVVAIVNWKKYQESVQVRGQQRVLENAHGLRTHKNPPYGGRGATADAAPSPTITDEMAEKAKALRMAP